MVCFCQDRVVAVVVLSGQDDDGGGGGGTDVRTCLGCMQHHSSTEYNILTKP